MTSMTSPGAQHAPHPLPPLAVVVTGPAGVGKSTAAAALARHLRAALLDLDSATAPMLQVVAGLMGSTDPDDVALARATRTARYEGMTGLAEDCLRCGTPVVLVAPYTAERTRPDAWAGLETRLEQAGGRPSMVWLHAPLDVLRERILGRAAERDSSKLADLQAHLARVDLTPPVVPHLAVDATAPLDLEALTAALRGA